MEFQYASFRNAEIILQETRYLEQYNELLNIIHSVSDDELKIKHNSYFDSNGIGGPKSLSVSINDLLREKFINKGWFQEASIFQDDRYQDRRWRLDFAKQDISIEVAFNHGEAIAWNLIKPVLASELNHVKKQIQTQLGVIITATQALKEAGGFDSAIGTYEKFLEYLPPLRNMLTVPILIIGLLPPTSFYIEHDLYHYRKYGIIREHG
jgi:hypothetical protein